MELEELALLTREEIVKEIYRRCPDPTGPTHADAYDQASEKRARLRETISKLQIGALLDGKLTIDQVVEQNHSPYDDPVIDTDSIHRNLLKQALEDLQEGVKSREVIIEEACHNLGHL